jgi:hypothetical protein
LDAREPSELVQHQTRQLYVRVGVGVGGSGGSDGSGDDAAERLTELKSKLTTPPPPAVVVPQSAVPKPGFWGGLFGLTIPPAAPGA